MRPEDRLGRLLPILFTALMRNLYEVLGVRSSTVCVVDVTSPETSVQSFSPVFRYSMTYLLIGLWPSFGARHVSFKEFVVISETSGGDGESGTSREMKN